MSEVNRRLIADLGKLVLRYNADEWRSVLRLLQDDAGRALLAALLEELASASEKRPTSGKAPPSSASPSTRERLKGLKKTDPRRAVMLDELWAQLRSRQLFSDMRSLRSFAEAIGMKDLRARKYDQAASEVVRYLIELPPEALEATLSQALRREDRRLGDEYARWVALILGPEGD
jgi:hypothetical protein